ncbi:hypothetical protein ACFOZY_00935 [Chungangia koreensis]|uniref:Transglutaminase-like superfamily protein n=1 Tax=Chungangia koreensis TaxID=752657 RepID=A0ABV8WZA6_9LACT
MEIPNEINRIYTRFDEFPMETLTKAWFANHHNGGRQRTIEEMKEHRSRYGIAGNCFDLAYWLIHEFQDAGIRAYPVGHDLATDDAHVAVVAHFNNRRYLCDLGDQWLQPICIDEPVVQPLSGFFPAAGITVEPCEHEVTIHYHRPNGKISRQRYQTEPVDMNAFLKAADFCQQNIFRKPLLEVRLPMQNETAHWEFYNWESFLSTSEGKQYDPPAQTIEEWAERIHLKTGYDRTFLIEALSLYREL